MTGLQLSPEYWRHRAEEIRTAALSFTDAARKALLERAAEACDRMAELIEKLGSEGDGSS
jgi:hypothetical protein